MTVIGKSLSTPQAVNNAINAVCDILRRSNVTGALQYIPELTWILFLRILDEREDDEAKQAAAMGIRFEPALKSPYRWRDWAAPGALFRQQLWERGSGALFTFVNDDLLEYLKGLKLHSTASDRQRIISEIMGGVEKVRIDTERNFLDVLDRVDAIRLDAIDDTHVFPLSQAYEGLLLQMGQKNNDGGQFFTPREVIRSMIRVIEPQFGETIYDPACGTGGFLAQAYEHLYGRVTDGEQLETLKRHTFYGREKENLIYPIALANLVLHGIDEPHIWHGNSLTGVASYADLFRGAPEQFDIVLTNPPFGGKEGKDAQTQFAYKTSATQVLFLQHVIDALKSGGRCAIVLDEGVLFRTNEAAFVQTKRKLLNDCDLWCIVSLPAGTFINAGGGVKTNLLFFNKGQRTEHVWYYDLSDVKVTKKNPLTLGAFEGFFEALPARATTERSWTVSRADIEARNYDLKAVNPNAPDTGDKRTPAELLDVIEAHGREVAAALAELRRLTNPPAR
jgi:type I restriction enzyme M protein